jgi:NTF2 fold immunity protein
MTNLLKVFAVSLMLVSASRAVGGADKLPLPPQGIIPDEVTAVKVAEVLFPPVFGADEVTKYLPYHAQLKDGVWTVYGTLKPGSRGGTPQMTIQKKDGKVIEVWHSQ